jgi:protein SCO1/2
LAPPSQIGRSGSAEEALQRYGPVPDFSLTERNGATVTLAQLRGKIWIADFIYTTCTDTCPLQTAAMAKLQADYAARPEVQLVSITVDPERDTPQAMARYADKYGADAERWYFLSGQRERTIKLIQQGFRLAVAAIPMDADAGGMIPHSPRFVLVDKEARIRGYYDSREQEALARLKKDIDTLVKG